MRLGKSLATVLPFVLGCLAVPTVEAKQSTPSGVNTVTATLSGLVHHPANWVGHMVQVRGKLVGCPYRLAGPCASWQPELADPVAADQVLPVQVHWVQARPMSSADRPVSGAQVVRWGAVGVYRVQLRAVAPALPTCATHYEGLLMDAVP
jgi:hypothetical protein